MNAAGCSGNALIPDAAENASFREMAPRAMTPGEQAIECLQRAIRHIENGDPNDIRAAWIEMGGARLWTRAMHPAPDQAGAMP